MIYLSIDTERNLAWQSGAVPRSFDRATALRRAMELFWAKGYDGASMSDLIAAMGVNSPSIYAAFGCKEELFREAVELYTATEGGRIWESMATAPSARAAIETMLRVKRRGFHTTGQATRLPCGARGDSRRRRK